MQSISVQQLANVCLAENASDVPGGKIEHSAPTGYPEHQGSGAPQAEPNVEEAQAITASKNEMEEKNKSTEAKFEKATGTAADGGNFDAARPNSGREAKRMLRPSPIHWERKRTS